MIVATVEPFDFILIWQIAGIRVDLRSKHSGPGALVLHSAQNCNISRGTDKKIIWH